MEKVLALKGAVFAAASALVTFTSLQGGGALLPSSWLDVTGDVALRAPIEKELTRPFAGAAFVRLVMWPDRGVAAGLAALSWRLVAESCPVAERDHWSGESCVSCPVSRAGPPRQPS